MYRRKFLQSTVALASVTMASQSIMTQANAYVSMDKDCDAYWETIRAQYKVTDEFTNLNAGHWGIM